MSEQEIRNITPAEARQRDRFDRKSVAVAEKMLRRMREMTHQPAALEPFLDTLSRIFVDRAIAMRFFSPYFEASMAASQFCPLWSSPSPSRQYVL